MTVAGQIQRMVERRRRMASAMGGLPPIQALFADGTDGYWFDLTKTDQTFQDRNNTPADEAGEAMELALERSQWGSSGLEAVLDAATNLASGGGWTMNTPGGTASASESPAGTLNLTGDGTNSAQGDKSFTTVTGAIYAIDPEVATNQVIVRAGTTQGATDVLTSRTVNVGTDTSGIRRRFYFRAASTTTWVRFNRQAAGAAVVSNIRIRRIVGNHGLQTTTGARLTRQAGPVARCDAVDDNWQTTFLAQNGANSIIAKVTVPASLSATQVIAGASGSSANRCFLGVNTSGQLCAGVGSDSVTTIVGTNDLRGTTVVVGLSFDGSTVKLFEETAEVYSAAQASTPTTTIPHRIGANNNNGTAGSFWGSDIWHALGAQKSVPLDHYLAIRAELNAS